MAETTWFICENSGHGVAVIAPSWQQKLSSPCEECGPTLMRK